MTKNHPAVLNEPKHPFFGLTNRAGLARFLCTDVRSLEALISAPERARYRFRQIGKKRAKLRRKVSKLLNVAAKPKKKRWAQEPINENHKIHKRIFRLLNTMVRPAYVFSGTRGQSYVSNARAHSGAAVIFKTDIQNFYGSVLWTDIFRFFRHRMMCSASVAEMLSDLCTVSAGPDLPREKRHLPTGSAVSEVLAYWAFAHMFDQIAEECELNELRLTTYVDDIAISGNSISHTFVQNILKIIGAHGLRAHKTRIRRGRAASITGVMVTPRGLRLPNRRHLEIARNRVVLARMRLTSEERLDLLRMTAGQCFEASQIIPRLKSIGTALKTQELAFTSNEDADGSSPPSE